MTEATRRTRIIGALALLAAACAGPAHAGDKAPLAIELNKLEQRDGACRAYLVVVNGTANAFTALKLDMVMFGKDGVIATRLALDAAPLPAAKTVVRPFDIGAVACADIGRILLNGLIACEGRSGPTQDCIEMIETTSRAAVPFIK